MLTPTKSLKLARACLGVHARVRTSSTPRMPPPLPRWRSPAAAEVRPSSARIAGGDRRVYIWRVGVGCGGWVRTTDLTGKNLFAVVAPLSIICAVTRGE